jgi:hypothetical protein
MYVNSYLLPLLWEQINDQKRISEEKRMLIAEACSTLAPCLYNDIRNSLMFSILKQIIELETNEMVRACAIRSLSLLINYLNDEKKFQQCIELMDMCITDATSHEVVAQVEQLMMPSLSLWSLNMLNKKKIEHLMNHLIERADFHLVNSIKQKNSFSNNKNDQSSTSSNFSLNVDHEAHGKTYLELINLNLQFLYAYILIHFREQTYQIEDSNEPVIRIQDSHKNKIAKLNQYYNLMQEKLECNLDLYKIESILDDYLSLSIKYLNLIETDSWSSMDLSNAFDWLSDKFMRKLIQMSAQIEAKDYLCPQFVCIFRNFTLLFAIDHEFIKSKCVTIFEKLLNIPCNAELSLAQQQLLAEQALENKSCPLYKSTLPVYFVGILSTLIDVEYYGWSGLNSDSEKLQALSKKNEGGSSPSSLSRDKVISSSASSNKLKPDELNNSSCNDGSLSQIEKKIEQMNIFLKNVFFTLSLNQVNFDGLIAIYELLK